MQLFVVILDCRFTDRLRFAKVSPTQWFITYEINICCHNLTTAWICCSSSNSGRCMDHSHPITSPLMCTGCTFSINAPFTAQAQSFSNVWLLPVCHVSANMDEAAQKESMHCHHIQWEAETWVKPVSDGARKASDSGIHSWLWRGKN